MEDLGPIITCSLLDLTSLGNARTTRAHSRYYYDGPCLVRAELISCLSRNLGKRGETTALEHAWLYSWQGVALVKGCAAAALVTLCPP